MSFLRKKEVRLMSSAMALVMAASAFTLAPTVAKAENKVPSVKVLGASLRLDAEEGCQSMRVGIEVTNASQAKSCGIVLKSGDKSFTVATEAMGEGDTQIGQNLYYYNETKDVVVYTAVIKDIPANCFETNIEVQGLVKAVDAQDVTTSGEAVTKSVSGVVNAMKAENDNIDMLPDGTLVKKALKVMNVADITQSADFTCGDNSTGEYDATTESYKLTTTAANGGINLAIPGGFGTLYNSTTEIGAILCANVKVEADNTVSLGRSNKAPVSKQIAAADGIEFVKAIYQEKSGNWPSYYLQLANAGTCYIKSFGLYLPLLAADMQDVVPDYDSIVLDLSKATTQGDVSTFEDGILSVDDTRTKDTTHIFIPLEEEIPVGKTVKVTIAGTSWGNYDFRVWTTTKGDGRTSGNYVENSQIYLNPNVKQNGSFVGSVELVTKGSPCENITLKPNFDQRITNLKISEVKILVMD